MARRGGSEAEREARLRLKERHEEEVRAYAAFFVVAERREEIDEELAALEATEAGAVAAMVATSGATQVADAIGWSVARVRNAVKLSGDDRDGDVERPVPIHTAADVA